MPAPKMRHLPAGLAALSEKEKDDKTSEDVSRETATEEQTEYETDYFDQHLATTDQEPDTGSETTKE